MINKFHRIINQFFIILLFMMCFHYHIAFAASMPEKHVLIMNPFTQNYPGSQLYIKGIKNALEKNSKFKFTYSYEYLELSRHIHDEDYLKDTAKYFKSKYLKDQPDFIITSIRLYFLFSKYGNDMFPNVPVIIDWDKENLPSVQIQHNHIIISQLDVVNGNIEVILKTKPHTKKIYIVVGSSVDKQSLSKIILDTQNKYSGKLEFVLLDKLSYEELMKIIKNAEDDSVILYFQWYLDVNGRNFVPVEVMQTICKESKVPVYGASEQYLGKGIIGGYLGSQELVGKTAGSVILDILRKKKLPDNSIIRAVSRTYSFDWRQLKHWKINEDKLPSGSVIKYIERSVWELYRGYIMGTIILLISQATFILVLLINRRQKRIAEAEFIQANNSLQAMTERLINIDRMKDEFLVTTAHELQTPLNAIINISDMLEQEKYGIINERQKEELRVILSVSRRLSSLIRDIIDIEKIKRNEMQLKFSSIDIKSASTVVVDVFKNLIQSKDIEFSINIPEGLSPILADENRLNQILYNLIGNAVKFTKKGKIILSAQDESGFIKISVEDTGVGISKKKQENLFNAFNCDDVGILDHYSGSGLGLYISRQLLKRMKGDIFLEWSEPQKGTCFSFFIPKATKEMINYNSNINKSIELPLKVLDTVEKSTNKLMHSFKILAVDDDYINIRVIKSLLGDEGYEILTASNGLEAIKMLKRNNEIDLVLMDVMMPKMSGYEACRKIREQYSLHDLPILLLTVRNTPEDITTGFDAGANDFVTKPLVAIELKARISTLLQMKKSVQEALRSEIAFLQSQIKPHFLYNTISSIAYLCHTDSERAAELLQYLSNYLRRCFDFNNKNTFVRIQKELELVQCYVEIEKARFEDRLQVEFIVDDEVLQCDIIPFTIQPLVENAIRHGVMKREEGGTIKIILNQKDNKIEVCVEDDGVGLSKHIMKNLLSLEEDLSENCLDKKNTSIGISNINDRLTKFYGEQLYMESVEEKGTKVYFKIPISYSCNVGK